MIAANEADILICTGLNDGRQYRQFTDSQLVPLQRRDRLEGRTNRKIWLTPGAWAAADSAWDHYLDGQVRLGVHVSPVNAWEPDQVEQVSLLDQLRGLKEAVTLVTHDIDYSEGYHAAIEDAIALITKALVASIDMEEI